MTVRNVKNGKKVFSFNLRPSTHKRLKLAALEQEISMGDFLEQALQFACDSVGAPEVEPESK
ncbi:MAG: toxin-antitoxin system HicB family antitoxin [Deltaproteobacteria bacterium]|nr:toxin-antitoxin system HicB family antitoxin [Deltaproteobacteria bacterium]